MNYKTLGMTVLMLGLPFKALAAECYGVPQVVKMGEYGAQEAYIILRMNSLDYRMGRPDDDAAMARMSIIQTALIAEKDVKLRFWNVDTCELASQERRVPNSVQLIK